jgi:cytochrome c5
MRYFFAPCIIFSHRSKHPAPHARLSRLPNRPLRVVIAVLALGAAACNGGGAVSKQDAAPLHCNVQAPTSCPEQHPVFADVQPIFARRCNPCHNGLAKDGPWPLKSYEEIVSWEDDVRSMVLNCEMPPPDGGIYISEEERQAILQWLRCGHPLTADADAGPSPDASHDVSHDSDDDASP